MLSTVPLINAAPQGLRLIVTDYFKKRAFAFLIRARLRAAALARGRVARAAQRLPSLSLRRLHVVGRGRARPAARLVRVGGGADLDGHFCFVPDCKVLWKSAAWGGLLTSLMFNVGNALVGLYLARAGVGAAYGAAGSAVVLLLWLQFSAHVFLLGAELTQQLQHRAPDGECVVGSPSDHRLAAKPAPELAGPRAPGVIAAGPLQGR